VNLGGLWLMEERGMNECSDAQVVVFLICVEREKEMRWISDVPDIEADTQDSRY
jgi:hypothetical protein